MSFNHLIFRLFSDVTELQLNMTDGDPSASSSSSVQLRCQHYLLSAHAVNTRLSDLSSQTSLVEEPPSSVSLQEASGFQLAGFGWNISFRSESSVISTKPSCCTLPSCESSRDLDEKVVLPLWVGRK